jgi:type VII secretion protein EccB
MATNRDQVAAYDYESRRRVTSLVLGADEAGRDPRKRLNRTLFGSIMIGVLVMAGFGIAGLLGGGRGPGVPESGVVLVKGSGDRYVVVNGVLHPALNLSSALLVGGGTVTQVRGETLNGMPRGLPIGIPNAPDGLPDKLATGPWTVCAQAPEAQRTKPPVSVLVGLAAPADGTLDASQAVIAQVGEEHWLVTGGRRYLLVGNAASALNLSLAIATGIAVPAEVLDTIPEGPRLIIPTVARGGAAPDGIKITGASVGDLIRSDVAGQPQFFLIQSDGVSQISQLVFTLLAADGRPVRAAPGSLAGAQQSHQPVPGQPGWPDQVPNAIKTQLDQPLCVSTVPGQPAGDAPWRVTVSVPGAMPRPVDATPVASRNGDLASVATSVTLAPGTDGALVRATTSSGQDGAYVLVTEVGQRYEVTSGDPGTQGGDNVTSADAVARLGFNPTNASPLPLPFVALLPAGPALDPHAAGQEYAGAPH